MTFAWHGGMRVKQAESREYGIGGGFLIEAPSSWRIQSNARYTSYVSIVHCDLTLCLSYNRAPLQFQEFGFEFLNLLCFFMCWLVRLWHHAIYRWSQDVKHPCELGHS
jgi:hypothetical protein